MKANCFSWNAQSLNNKGKYFLEKVEDINADFGFISETWLQSDKNDITALVKDKGYLLRHVKRDNRAKEGGGGVGILLKSSISSKQLPCKVYSSFEHIIVSVKLVSNVTLHLITIYRLHIVSSTIFHQ